MRKRGERTLKELYSFTEKITQPEITPVLEGNYRIQGPVDESDHELCRTNSGTFQAAKRFAFINNSFHMKMESGTCNVCSAPCSSCMHNNRTLLAMESKIVCGSSRNSCAVKQSDGCSFICADGMPLYKSRMCDEPAASEASNFVSASPSHDSDSENAESKAITCGEDVNMPPHEPLRLAADDQTVQEKRSNVDDCLFLSNSHLSSDLCHSTCPSKDERGELGCLGDNISCVTGTTDFDFNVGHGDLDFDKKIATCTALTDILLPQPAENAMRFEGTIFSHDSKNEDRQSRHRKQITFSEESFQKKHACSTNAFPANLVEMNPSNHNFSPKLWSPRASPRNGYVVCNNGACKDSNVNSDCQPCIDGTSPLGIELEVATDDKKKITDTDVKNENSLGEVIKSKNANDDPAIPSSLVDVPSVQQPPIQLRQVMENGSPKSEPELTDIKVCDICGDAGREELLAVCSRCSDGAEHTYCMRKKMRKIPEGDWLCEECQMKDDAERKKVDKPEKLYTTGKVYKVKEDTEVKKVDRSEKLSETAKDCKVKERVEVKKGIGSEAVFGLPKECKQDDIENNKAVKKSETTPGTPKSTCRNETSPNFRRMPNSKFLPKLDVNAVDLDMRRVPKGLPSPKISAKRHAVSQDVIFFGSKRSSDVTNEGIEIGSPRKKPSLSRESSFEYVDTGKEKVQNMPKSNGCQSLSRSQSVLGSHLSKVQSQLQPPHRLLARSSSFNNLNLKPKRKQLTESAHVHPKISRESLSKEKEALVSSMTKSASFKSTASGHFNTESVSKTKFIHQSRVEDPRCLKHVKERKAIEKKGSFVLDRPPSNLSPRVGTITSLSKMDVKTALHNVKLNNAVKPNIHRANKGSDTADGLGTNGTKPFGSASLNARHNNEDQRPCQTSRNGGCGTSSFNDKFSSNAEVVQLQGVVQPAGSTRWDDKTKDYGVFSNSREACLVGDQILSCQRCNESGHVAEFCSLNKVHSSSLKPSAEKNLKDGNKKGNKWNYAVQTTISNSRLQKKIRQNNHDQLEEFPDPSADKRSEVSSEDFPSCSTNPPIESPLLVRAYSGLDDISKSLDVDCMKTAHVMDVEQLSFPPAEASCAPISLRKMESSCTPEPNDLSANASDELNAKCFPSILHDQASTLANPCRSSAIPELEFIWQGSLEILTSGNEPSSFNGIQAHLSASASPKVLEVATKLPCRVQLEEVCCITSWPLQFRGSNPDEHNIALFFFAKDVESYERSYSKLLENMLKNDLALRGVIDGVELLIFPSTKLSAHSQRWNGLYFLWGIFKGRRANCFTSKLSPGKRPSTPIFDKEQTIQDLPYAVGSVMSDSWKSFSVDISENKSARFDMPSEAVALKSITHMDTWPVPSCKVEDRMCEAQENLVHSSSFQLEIHNSQQSGQSSFLFPVSHSPINEIPLSILPNGHLESRFLVADTFSCSEVKNDNSYQKNFSFRGCHVNTTVHLPTTDEQIASGSASPTYCISPDYIKGREKSGKGLKEAKMRGEGDIFYDESRRKPVVINKLNWEKSNRERAHSYSSAISHDLGSSRETVLWKDEIDCLPIYTTTDNRTEWENVCFREVDASNRPREETLNVSLSSKVPRDEDNVEAVILDNSVRAEKFFFPLRPSPVPNTPQSENLIQSSRNEDSSESDIFDLELALGSRWRTQKKCKKEEDEEDNASASLSLSLAISTSNVKSEQNLQGRPDLNASLLLFDGFSGA